MWSYSVNESVNVDPTAVAFNPSGDFYKDVATFCELAKIRVHPFLHEPDPVLLFGIVRRTRLSCRHP